MAEIAAGDYRFARYGVDGNRKEMSEQFNYDILNNTPTPRIAFNGAGTIQDQQVSLDATMSGPGNDVLILELRDTAARTFATANCVVSFNVRAWYRDTLTGKVTSTLKPLGLVDRVTKSTSGTRTDPQGVNDNPVTVANEFSTVICFKPVTSENWQIEGYQRFVSDGT